MTAALETLEAPADPDPDDPNPDDPDPDDADVDSVAAVVFAVLPLDESVVDVPVDVCDSRSVARVWLAVVTVWFASVTAVWRLVGSSVARVCPAVTVCPTCTSTAPTVPATWKAASSRLADETVPVRAAF